MTYTKMALQEFWKFTLLQKQLRPLVRFSACSLICLMFLRPAQSQTFTDPPVTYTFDQAIQSLGVQSSYLFGTGAGRTLGNLTQLATYFSPYGIAGTAVINQEWQHYQPFNSTNFVFTSNTLNLTATIPAGGGPFLGGINSGQIWSNQVFEPNVTGSAAYAFEVRMMIPSALGTWPAVWFYTKTPGEDDGSEIDNPEFFVMEYQNQFDWTGYQHGPGQGAQIYSIKTNVWLWRPGLNFAADYHDYQMLWTPDAVYKYVDGTLVYAQYFKWTARGAAQMGVDLAVGSDDPTLPGLKPLWWSEFPTALSIDHITIWAQ